MKEELKGKKFLITGGTGSFGHAVTDRLLKEGAGEIVIPQSSTHCRRWVLKMR